MEEPTTAAWCARDDAPMLPFPGMGLEVRVLLSSAASRGLQCVTEFAFAEPFGGPPLHWHANYSETFIVIEGIVTMVFADRERQLRPGDVVFVPESVPHTYRIDHPGPTRYLLVCSAESNFDRYAQDACALFADAARDGTPVSMERLREVRRRYGTYEVGHPPS